MNKDIQTLIEREAKEYMYSEKHLTGHYTDVQIEQFQNDSFIDGASFAFSLFKWRKVSEGLPPAYQDVIFKVNVFAETYHSEIASIGHIVHDGGYKLQIDLLARDILEYEITEWMPIPQID